MNANLRFIPYLGYIDDDEVERPLGVWCAHALGGRREPYNETLTVQPANCGYRSVKHGNEAIGIGRQLLMCISLAVVRLSLETKDISLLCMMFCKRFDHRQFTDHFAIDAGINISSLVFVNSDGKSLLVPKRAMVEMVWGGSVKPEIMDSSQSGDGGRAHFNEGVAQDLVSRGLPAVVFKQNSLLDLLTLATAKRFCKALSHRIAVGQAVQLSRITVNFYVRGPTNLAVPVVCMHNLFMEMRKQFQAYARSFTVAARAFD